MRLNSEAIAYLAAVASSIGTGRLPADALTDRCPECGELATYLDNDDHIVLPRCTGPGEEYQVAVVIGCEGYWVIDPNAVGIRSDAWQDWRSSDVSIPWKANADASAGHGRCGSCSTRASATDWRQTDDN